MAGALFLEDAFAESHAECLRSGGHPRAERLCNHFQDFKRKTLERGVKGLPIISFCDQHSWGLVIVESNMSLRHCELIQTTQAAILATAHNHAEDMAEWIEGLVAAETTIERHWKKFPRPWCAFLRQGKVHTKG
jgi:hypothetical protein